MNLASKGIKGVQGVLKNGFSTRFNAKTFRNRQRTRFQGGKKSNGFHDVSLDAIRFVYVKTRRDYPPQTIFTVLLFTALERRTSFEGDFYFSSGSSERIPEESESSFQELV